MERSNLRRACVTRKPSPRLQALVGENQNANAAPPLSKPEDYHHVNTFFTSLEKILAEIENRFSGNDQDLCALGDIILSYPSTSHSFDLFAKELQPVNTRI